MAGFDCLSPIKRECTRRSRDAQRKCSRGRLLRARATTESIRAIRQCAQRRKALIGRRLREEIGSASEGLCVLRRDSGKFLFKLHLTLNGRIGAAEEHHRGETSSGKKGERTRETVVRSIRHGES